MTMWNRNKSETNSICIIGINLHKSNICTIAKSNLHIYNTRTDALIMLFNHFKVDKIPWGLIPSERWRVITKLYYEYE